MAVWKVSGDAKADMYQAMKESHIFAIGYGYTGDLTFLGNREYIGIFDRRYLESLRREEESRISYDNTMFRFFIVPNEASDDEPHIKGGHFVVVFQGKEPLGITRLPEDRVCVYLDDELASRREGFKLLAENEFRHAWFPCVWVDWKEFVEKDEPSLADYKLKVRQVRGIEVFYEERLVDFPFKERWEALAPELTEDDKALQKELTDKFAEHSKNAAQEYLEKRNAFIRSLS